MTVARCPLPLSALLLVSVSARAEPPANGWTRLERGDIPGSAGTCRSATRRG
jgi:hypothetical protein